MNEPKIIVTLSRMPKIGLNDVSSVSFRVGYDDPSYFSHDYKKLFGQPSPRDIANLRKNLEH